ncbi:MAG: hypothetical protein HOQ05_11935 [Corynebacteriales bacterium]|nr:hypothetical protein [Mycobacteriales bacterium]
MPDEFDQRHGGVQSSDIRQLAQFLRLYAPKALNVSQTISAISRSEISSAYAELSESGKLLAHMALLIHSEVLPPGSRVPGVRWFYKTFSGEGGLDISERAVTAVFDVLREQEVVGIRHSNDSPAVMGMDYAAFTAIVGRATELVDGPSARNGKPRFEQLSDYFARHPNEFTMARGSPQYGAAMLADAVVRFHAPGDQFPTALWLAEAFNTNYLHIQHMRDILRNAGWIVSEPGRGTKVAPYQERAKSVSELFTIAERATSADSDLAEADVWSDHFSGFDAYFAEHLDDILSDKMSKPLLGAAFLAGAIEQVGIPGGRFPPASWLADALGQSHRQAQYMRNHLTDAGWIVVSSGMPTRILPPESRLRSVEELYSRANRGSSLEAITEYINARPERVKQVSGFPKHGAVLFAEAIDAVCIDGEQIPPMHDIATLLGQSDRQSAKLVALLRDAGWVKPYKRHTVVSDRVERSKTLDELRAEAPEIRDPQELRAKMAKYLVQDFGALMESRVTPDVGAAFLAEATEAVLREGEQLPPAKDLAEMFQRPPEYVRKFVARMRDAGWAKKQGRVIVVAPAQERRLSIDDMRAGLDPSQSRENMPRQ